MGTEKTQTNDIDIIENHQLLNSNITINSISATATATTSNCSPQKLINLINPKLNVDNDEENLKTNQTFHVLDIEINENNVIDGAKQILKAIRSDWDLNHVHFKLFTDGITNKLVGCFKNDPNRTTTTSNSSNSSQQSESNQEQQNDDAVVLVRVYGKKTDMLIDRTAETKNMRLLHCYGFAPTIFAVFVNGIAYEYIPGVTLTPNTIIQPKIWILIAKRMAEMHQIEIPIMTFTNDTNSLHNNCHDNNFIQKIPMLSSKTDSFLNLIPQQFTNPIQHARFMKIMPPIEELRTEWINLYNKLQKLNSPIVFAHNDLLLGNVIYTENLNRVTFIDYEYAAYNYQAFDIGNHFTEFAGIDDIDYSRYPSKEFQLKWLRVYLETYLNTNHVDSNDIERLYVQANQFALASHFFWTIWALIQAEHSTIDFDFIQFAQMRYGEYLARKDQFLALKY